MARVLVTGAAGFIGSHLSEALLSRGDEVIGLDNFDPFYDPAIKRQNLEGASQHARFVFKETDLRSSQAVNEVFGELCPTSVVHLAAKAGVRPSLENPAAYIETNLIGLQSLLTACSLFPVERFIFASSSSVYGDRADAPFKESDRTDEPASPYAATKKAGEGLCYTFHALTETPLTCLRFFTVYGPRQRPDLAIHKFAKLIDAGAPIPFFGDGTTSRDYTYVSDTVKGILGALDSVRGFEIYNLGRRDPITLNEMVQTLESALGKEAVLDRRPIQPGDVTSTCADISKAASAFGYNPIVGFEEGIRRFVEWYRNPP